MKLYHKDSDEQVQVGDEITHNGDAFYVVQWHQPDMYHPCDIVDIECCEGVYGLVHLAPPTLNMEFRA